MTIGLFLVSVPVATNPLVAREPMTLNKATKHKIFASLTCLIVVSQLFGDLILR